MINKLKQFNDLRKKAKTLQTALAGIAVEGSAAGGKVIIAMDGNQQCQKVVIDPSMLEPSGKMKLESAVQDALNDAIKKGHKKMAEKMKGMEGFNIPGIS